MKRKKLILINLAFRAQPSFILGAPVRESTSVCNEWARCNASASPSCFSRPSLLPRRLYPSRERVGGGKRSSTTRREARVQPSRNAGRRDRADTPVFPSQAAHAMINITPQSYGIQTDPETDFFLFQASRRPKGKCNFRDESSIEIGSQKLGEGWDERRVARRDEAVVTIAGKNFGQKVFCRIETNGMGFLCFPFGCSSPLLRFEARLMV